jgi:pimeloyl-ACP methyl ester carboxylesterase
MARRTSKEYQENRSARPKKAVSQVLVRDRQEGRRSPVKSGDDFRQASLGAQCRFTLPPPRSAQGATLVFGVHLSYRGIHDKFPPAALAQIGTPTAIFVGEHDVITTPFEANQLHCGIKDSTLLTVKSAGHFPWVERPTAFFRDFDRAARKIF